MSGYLVPSDGSLVRPLFLADNQLSIVQYPDHSVEANEETDGIGSGQAFRLADGRRHTVWTPTTANQEATVTWDMNQPRTSDMLVIDRESSVTRVIYEVSDDDFTTSQEVFDITLPVNPGTGTPDDDLGVRTEEGAWLKRFDPVIASYGRIRIPAMGAGLKPSLTGLWVGKSWKRTRYDMPFEDETDDFLTREVMSQTGNRGRGTIARPRMASMLFQFMTLEDWEEFRFHVLTTFGRGAPMWVVHDFQQADRAVLVSRTAGSRIRVVSDRERPNYRRAEMELVEHAPLEGR